jgi:hypothetical protein
MSDKKDLNVFEACKLRIIDEKRLAAGLQSTVSLFLLALCGTSKDLGIWQR